MPDTTVEAMAVFEAGGLGSQDTFNSTVPVIERPRAQVVARSTLPDEGSPASSTGVRSLIDLAYKNLHQSGRQTFGGTTYLNVRAVAPPALLEVDERGRQLWFVNFDSLRLASATNE